jgi:sortase A
VAGVWVGRSVRALGWTLIASGAVVLLYVVYLLWFTNLETDRSQRELADRFGQGTIEASGDPVEPDDDAATPDDPDEPEPDDDVEVGDAVAALWFQRGDDRIIHDEVLYVVGDVTLSALRAGPGHYPTSDAPGGAGNFAIAGHRTTYGSPFWSLNELQDGDTIHVLDPEGREWVYAYREQRIVAPGDVWVVGDDPLQTGQPTITLTTCHPRGSARQRLIAWGELLGDPRGSDGEGGADDEELEELPET